jgi:phosphate transport system substrate-binding protein
MIRLLYLSGLFFIVLFSFTAQALTLRWSGCGVAKEAFMVDLAEAYKKKTGIEINIEGGGDTHGIQRIANGEVDFAGTCRFRVEEDGISKSQIEFSPVAWDALAVVVHKSNPIESITLEQLRDIYTGKIRDWSVLGGEHRPLELLIRRGKISGVGHTIRKLLFNDHDMEFQASEIFKSSGPLEAAVEQKPGAIAMTGVSGARKRDFKILRLEGKEPSFENIRSGTYLLYRPLYVLTNKDSENLKAVKEFISFAHSREGRDIIRRNGCVPYLEAVQLSNTQRNQWKAARHL